MQLSRKDNKTKPEKEAAIHTTAVNEINRKGKSIAPLPTTKDLPHLRERNRLLLELEFLCNSSKTKFPIMPKHNYIMPKADVRPPAEETEVPEGFEHFCALKFDTTENFTAATCQLLSRSN